MGLGSGTGSAAWIRDSMIRSWTRSVSREASWRMRPANRSTASGSCTASSTVSASRARAPTGVLSSWLMLATKSRRTSSTRRLSVWSSASSSTSPPSADLGAERGHPDREAGGAPVGPAGRDLDLALADLAVPADLAGQRDQLADDQRVAVDQPERAGGGAGSQHPVVASPGPRPTTREPRDGVDTGRQAARPDSLAATCAPTVSPTGESALTDPAVFTVMSTA